MPAPLLALLVILRSLIRSRVDLQLENLALRHQIGVLQRSVKNRTKLTSMDRLLWVSLSRIWHDWRSALAIVKPETVVAWHHKGFCLFWAWKVRHGRPGRPAIARETRDLIRRMSRENPTWGAPRIHGELLKLGMDIGESSVTKYMLRCRKPPSQTWRTFLDNHLSQLVSIDFFTVPTIRFQVQSLLKSLLDNVFGIFTDSREAQRDREYLRLAPLEQGFKHMGVPAICGNDKCMMPLT